MPNDAILVLREQAVALELRAKAIESEEAARAAALPPVAAVPAAAVVPVPAAAPAIGHEPPPGAPTAPVGPQPPAGKVPLTVADLNSISQKEAVERMDEVDVLLRQERS
jgi:hypothetical protein